MNGNWAAYLALGVPLAWLAYLVLRAIVDPSRVSLGRGDEASGAWNGDGGYTGSCEPGDCGGADGDCGGD